MDKYILWYDSVHLTDASWFIHCPFNFDSRSDIISAQQFIALIHWKVLLTPCNALGIVRPSFPPSVMLRPRKREEKNNINSIMILYVYTLVLMICVNRD